MEKIIFREIENVNWKLVERITELEKRNLGREASINQWAIPVIIRYGKLIAAKKSKSSSGRKEINSKESGGGKESDSSDIIGICELVRNWKKEDSAFIHSFYIDKKYRNKGIGKKLLQRVIDILKNDNFKIVELTVGPDNEAASRLYRSFGFKKIGLRKNEYGRGVNRNLMRLKIQ